jgi:hypothetical protein
MRWNSRQACTTHWKDRRTYGIYLPTKKKFGGRGADASLARAHAAAGVQFGGTPAAMFAQSFVRDVFAAADQRVWAREIFQLGTQRESVFQDAHTFPVTGALRE